MEGWLNMTKSIGDDVFVPMAGSLPMMRRRNLTVADRFVECNIPDVTVTKTGPCHHKHCKAYLLSTSLCINLKQV